MLTLAAMAAIEGEWRIYSHVH